MKRLGLLILFGSVTALAMWPTARGAGDGASADRDRVAALRRQFALFQSLPPQRQQQIRELDRQLHELDEPTQKRLRRVMENYAAWLDRLSDEERKRVTSALPGEDRLVTIRDIRRSEWLESLPETYREQYAKAGGQGGRAKLVDQWRQEQQDREEEWLFALKHWTDLGQGQKPAPFRVELFNRQLEQYLQNLDPSLTEAERGELKAARQAAEQRNDWLTYGKKLVQLSERHPLVPGPVGPRNYEALPAAVKAALPGGFAKRLPAPLDKATGRWPEFGLAVAHYAQENNIKLPEPLGPTTKDKLPPEARAAADRLEKVIGRADKLDKGQKELRSLREAEKADWPAYPVRLMELAAQYKMPVPGWTLPVPPNGPDFWGTIPNKRIRPKQ